MKIKTLFIIETTVFIVAAVCIGILVLLNSFAVNRAVLDFEKASELQKDFYELSILRSDYLLNRGAGARDQWVAKQKSVQEKLGRMMMSGAAQNREIQRVKTFVANIREVTGKLLSIPGVDRPGLKTEASTAAENAQVEALLKLNAQISSVLGVISSATASRLTDLQNLNTWLGGLCLYGA
jgi:hypothetical protein